MPKCKRNVREMSCRSIFSRSAMHKREKYHIKLRECMQSETARVLLLYTASLAKALIMVGLWTAGKQNALHLTRSTDCKQKLPFSQQILNIWILFTSMNHHGVCLIQCLVVRTVRGILPVTSLCCARSVASKA